MEECATAADAAPSADGPVAGRRDRALARPGDRRAVLGLPLRRAQSAPRGLGQTGGHRVAVAAVLGHDRLVALLFALAPFDRVLGLAAWLAAGRSRCRCFTIR